VKAVIVGRRSSLVSSLVAVLTERGHDAVAVTGDEAAPLVRAESVDIVAFGRAVKDAERRRIMEAARSRAPRAQRVDGLAPIVPLLVVQCEWAGRRASGATDGDPRVVVEAVPVPRVAVRRVGGVADVEIERHRLTPWFTSTSMGMPVEADGTDAVAWFARRPSASRDFVSVRVDGDAVFVGDSLGRLPLCQ
jgi:hypothetical protein